LRKLIGSPDTPKKAIREGRQPLSHGAENYRALASAATVFV